MIPVYLSILLFYCVSRLCILLLYSFTSYINYNLYYTFHIYSISDINVYIITHADNPQHSYMITLTLLPITAIPLTVSNSRAD